MINGHWIIGTIKGYENFTNNKSLEEILAKPLEIPEEIRGGVINQGGGVSNHNICFSILSKNPKKQLRYLEYNWLAEGWRQVLYGPLSEVLCI